MQSLAGYTRGRFVVTMSWDVIVSTIFPTLQGNNVITIVLPITQEVLRKKSFDSLIDNIKLWYA